MASFAVAPGRVTTLEFMLQHLCLCHLADGRAPPPAEGFSDGQQTNGHKICQPQLSCLWRRLHDGNALSRTLGLCLHRPACDDPKQPANLADSEMKAPDQMHLQEALEQLLIEKTSTANKT